MSVLDQETRHPFLDYLYLLALDTNNAVSNILNEACGGTDENGPQQHQHSQQHPPRTAKQSSIQHPQGRNLDRAYSQLPLRPPPLQASHVRSLDSSSSSSSSASFHDHGALAASSSAMSRASKSGVTLLESWASLIEDEANEFDQQANASADLASRTSRHTPFSSLAASSSYTFPATRGTSTAAKAATPRLAASAVSSSLSAIIAETEPLFFSTSQQNDNNNNQQQQHQQYDFSSSAPGEGAIAVGACDDGTVDMNVWNFYSESSTLSSAAPEGACRERVRSKVLENLQDSLARTRDSMRRYRGGQGTRPLSGSQQTATATDGGNGSGNGGGVVRMPVTSAAIRAKYGLITPRNNGTRHSDEGLGQQERERERETMTGTSLPHRSHAQSHNVPPSSRTRLEQLVNEAVACGILRHVEPERDARTKILNMNARGMRDCIGECATFTAPIATSRPLSPLDGDDLLESIYTSPLHSPLSPADSPRNDNLDDLDDGLGSGVYHDRSQPLPPATSPTHRPQTFPG